MKCICTLIFIVFCSISESQVYDFLNEDILFKHTDTVYLKKTFLNIDNHIKVKFFTEINLRQWWSPLPLISTKTPSIEPFLDNFDLNHLQSDIINSQNDSVIDFLKLNHNFYPASEDFRNENTRLTYVQISKPFYNCSKNWLILFIDIGNGYKNYNSGFFYVYKKEDDKWILYNKVELWFS